MADLNLLPPLCVFCVSGTTAKHVVFLAGNTAKHGLRCKACKMSLHHKCENGVGQQRCMGKLVRAELKLSNILHTFLLNSVWEILSLRNINTDVTTANKTDILALAVWAFPTRMCLFRNHTLRVSVCWYICDYHPPSSSSSSSLYHHVVSLCASYLWCSTHLPKKNQKPTDLLLTSAGFCLAAVRVNHYRRRINANRLELFFFFFFVDVKRSSFRMFDISQSRPSVVQYTGAKCFK